VGLVRSAGHWLVAFVFSYAVWMVHDDSAKLPELLAGILVATIAATGTELVRRQRVAGIAIAPSWLRHAPRLIPSAVRDCIVLTRLALTQLVRRDPACGRTVAIPFGHGGEDPPENGRRALAQALGSFAPSTIVVGVDPERNLLIAHQLAASCDPGDLDPLELG
jgi:multisubunit Na+/H+ antiporter MnhE subunit